jgi:hypothetical protein
MVRNPPVSPRNDVVWRRLAGIVLLMAAGWAAALVYHYVMGAVLRLPYPSSTFLFDPADRFNDLLATRSLARAPDPYSARGPGAAAYFPLVYAALRLLLHRPNGTWLIVIHLLASLGISASVALLWIRRERPRWSGDSRWPVAAALVLFVVLANYPFLMAVDRGNFDPIITALIVFAVVLLREDRPTLGGALLGVASAAKGYPIVAALLWLRRRRPAGAVVAVVTFVALVVLPGLIFAGGITGTLRGLSSGLARFRELYVVGDWSAHYSADALNAIRLVLQMAGAAPDMQRLVPRYELFALLWAALLCADALFVAGATWRRALAIVLVMLVFPNVTNDYKLVLLVPVTLLWISSAAESDGWRDRLFGVCVALLFVPKHYGVLIAGRDATVSCLVSPLLVAGLTVVLWPTAEELAQARARLARARAVVGGRPAAGAAEERS